jgi:hypothetical protein
VNWNSPMKEAMERLHSLDALEANTLSDNPQAMASWTVARTVICAGGRVSRKRGRHCRRMSDACCIRPTSAVPGH